MEPAPTISVGESPPGDCGSDELIQGANVSERDAIDKAFPRRHDATCDRFITVLRGQDGGLVWEIRLDPKHPFGCQYGKSVDALSGKLLPGVSAGCP